MTLTREEVEARHDLWGPPLVRESVSEAAYGLLRKAIVEGRLRPGARINEQQLSEALEISRTPIRDALRQLQAEGLVRPAGRGLVVPRLTQADIEELYDLREALEALAARRAAEQGATDLRGTLNAVIKAYGVALKQADYQALAAADVDLHRSIVRAAGSKRLEKAVDLLAAQVHQVRVRAVRLRGRAAKSFREMAKLTAAIRARDAGRAEASMREHILSLKADILAGAAELDIS